MTTETVNSDTQMEDADGHTETVVETDPREARLTELEQSNRQLYARAKTAEGFVKVDNKWVKAPTPEEAIQAINAVAQKTGELNETQLDYLDLKGIVEEDDVKVIQDVMKRTGQTVRQVLNDDYVKNKLKYNSESRAVRNATPSSSKRSGQGAVDDLAYWIERNERTNEMPEDFALRAKIVEAKEKRFGNSSPAWRR